MSLGKDDLKREMKPVKVIGPAALGTLYGILQGIEAAGEIVLPAPEPVVEAPGAVAPKKNWGPAVKMIICRAEMNSTGLDYSMFQMLPNSVSMNRFQSQGQKILLDKLALPRPFKNP